MRRLLTPSDILRCDMHPSSRDKDEVMGEGSDANRYGGAEGRMESLRDKESKDRGS